jgi:hypothetical protein
MKSRPFRKSQNKKSRATQQSLINNQKLHFKYDLEKYNKLKSIEKTVKKVEESDINLKQNIRKNEQKDIKFLEQKIKNDEKLSDEEKQRYELYVNNAQNQEVIDIKPYRETKDQCFNFTPAEEKDIENFTPEEEKEIANQSNRSKQKYIQNLIKQKKINIIVNRILESLFNTNIVDSSFRINYWNGLKNSKIDYIETLYIFLYKIHEKSKTDIYDFLIFEKNNKFQNPFQIPLSYRNDKNKTRDEVIKNSLLKNISPARFNKFYELKFNMLNEIPGGDLIGKSLKNYLPPLYESDINEYYKNEPRYIGTFAIDEVKNIINQNPDNIKGYGFIVNNSSRDQNDNTDKHWTAVYIDKHNIEIYDPLAKHLKADEILKQLKPEIEKNNILYKLKQNTNMGQNPLSYLCGYHCISFLNKKFNGADFKTATDYDKNYNQATKDIRNRFKYI